MKKFLLVSGLIIIGIILFSSNQSEVQSISTANNNIPTITPSATMAPAPTFRPLPDIFIPDLDFHGKPCTQDCSGHEAGYNWAEEKGIDDVDDCGGKSQSFIEGCQSYVEENYGTSDSYDGPTILDDSENDDEGF